MRYLIIKLTLAMLNRALEPFYKEAPEEVPVNWGELSAIEKEIEGVRALGRRL